MKIEYIRKIKVELTNEEIEALKTAEKIIRNFESELENNGIEDSDEMEEIIGEAYGEQYCYCSNTVSDIISEIIGLTDC
jgi:hypothetical protein